MGREKIYNIIDFLEEYSSNKDIKKILNSTLNDIVLAVVSYTKIRRL